jgi:hypothetical protein
MTPEEARNELLTKSLEQIHETSALGWLERALAARQLFFETHDVKWAITYADLRHECLEHAALSENPLFLSQIQARLATT